MDEKNENVPLTKEEIVKIARDFEQSMKALKELPVPVDNDTSGIPIFKEEDIMASQNELDVPLRMLFVRYGITRLRFARQFQRYAVSILNIAEMNINAQRENYLRAIKDGNITWVKFKNTLGVILGLKMRQLVFDFLRFDGAKVSVTANYDDVKLKR